MTPHRFKLAHRAHQPVVIIPPGWDGAATAGATSDCAGAVSHSTYESAFEEHPYRIRRQALTPRIVGPRRRHHYGPIALSSTSSMRTIDARSGVLIGPTRVLADLDHTLWFDADV